MKKILLIIVSILFGISLICFGVGIYSKYFSVSEKDKVDEKPVVPEEEVDKPVIEDEEDIEEDEETFSGEIILSEKDSSENNLYSDKSGISVDGVDYSYIGKGSSLYECSGYKTCKINYKGFNVTLSIEKVLDVDNIYLDMYRVYINDKKTDFLLDPEPGSYGLKLVDDKYLLITKVMDSIYDPHFYLVNTNNYKVIDFNKYGINGNKFADRYFNVYYDNNTFFVEVDWWTIEGESKLCYADDEVLYDNEIVYSLVKYELNDGQLINDVIFKKSTLNEMLSEKYNTSCNEVRENNKE